MLYLLYCNKFLLVEGLWSTEICRGLNVIGFKASHMFVDVLHNITRF